MRMQHFIHTLNFLGVVANAYLVVKTQELQWVFLAFLLVASSAAIYYDDNKRN